MSEGRLPELTLHASCVAWEGRGLLIIGPSGVGKSALALELMAYGAMLVADDRTCLERRSDGVWASAPKVIAGLVEARGIGLLRAEASPSVRVLWAVDLTEKTGERLPQLRERTLLGHSVVLIPGRGNDHLGPALMQLLKKGLDHRR